MDNIYEIPTIKAIKQLEQEETNPTHKQELHTAWLAAIKLEQIKRGQRTKVTYRNQ